MKLGRATLWVMLPGVAWLRSRRERRERELLALLAHREQPVDPPEANEIRRRRDEINARFSAAGLVGSKRDQARRQLAHLTAGEGMTVDDALDRIAPPA